jgi:hypothetical protein
MQLIGPLLAIAYGLVWLALTVVLSIEVAWCGVLSGDAALWVLALFVPKVNAPGAFLALRWAGSLLSPLVALTALHMAAPRRAT